jgi:UDP-2,3-diacylglucosamine pyrophosphatase LpxH
MKFLFVSDVHLGAKSSQSDKFLKLLKTIEKNPPEVIYIIGDFIDGWKFTRKKFHWTEKETKILRKLLKFVQNGVKIVYVAGNHDDFMRKYIDTKIMDNFCIVDQCCVITPDNKKYLVIHGDQFDVLIKHKYANKWMMYLGDSFYEATIHLSRKYMKIFNSNFSISKYIKTKFKNAMMFISCFESTLQDYAERNDYDGVICGHIHFPRVSDDLRYLNTGDFVENNSCIFMSHEGKFELLYM